MILDHINNLDSFISNGGGIWLSSAPGMAKSSIISYILRKSIDLGRKCYCDSASHFLSHRFDALKDSNAKEFISNILEFVELLAMEEVDKIYLLSDSSINNHLFYEFISDIYDSNKALIISSNSPREDVLKRFPTFVGDRLKTLTYIELRGNKSGRESD
jgi:DNA replication protein DnaC